MYIAYGLAIIRLPRAGGISLRRANPFDEKTARQREIILNRFGLKHTDVEPSKVDLNLDMMSGKELIILPLDDGREAWLGWSLAIIQDQLLSVRDLKLPNFDAAIFTLDFEDPMFTYQYIENGVLGPAALNSQKKAWNRVFRKLPIPQFKERNQAIINVAERLGADLPLVQRAVTGMKGKGFYGMAFHPEKNDWVIARSLAEKPSIEPNMFHELNPNSYKKKGKPTPVAIHPQSGHKFLSNLAVFEMMIQEMIWLIFGFRVNYVDGVPYDQQYSDKDCLRGKAGKLAVKTD